MPRHIKLFPRYRRPSVNEILGITQAKRRVSRKYHLATLRDPMTPWKNAERRAKRRMGYYSEPMKMARKLGLIKRGGCLIPVAGLLVILAIVAGLGAL